MIGRILVGIWRGLDGARKFLHLVLLLTIFGFVVGALKTSIPHIADHSALVIVPRGEIVEGDKDRIQVFQGVVVKKHRAGLRSSFTVRKVSFNVGVERIFLSHSPRIDKVEVVSRGVVRRSRLFYLRGLAGKAARVRDAKD